MSKFILLMVWGLLWMITWPIVTAYKIVFRKPRADNCFTWAIRKWHQHGGYLVIRWCRSSKTPVKWPHFLWLPDNDKNVVHYVPKKAQQGERYVPDVFFEGKVTYGDDKDQLEN